MNNSKVGVINLEGLMSRANIWFTSGYHFKGVLDIARLQASFLVVVDAIGKFDHRLDFRAQNDFSWQAVGAFEKSFQLVESDDIDLAFKALCRDSLSLAGDGQHNPMVLTVIRNSKDYQHFIIAQTSEHTYLDARSSEIIFNLIVQHYNASLCGDEDRLGEIVKASQSINTCNSQAIIEILTADGHDREGNVAHLSTYPVADVGGYAIPLAEVPDCLARYKEQRFSPVTEFFDIKELLGRCRTQYPEVTQNSVVCAALAKGFYNLNRQARAKPENHLISFKMLSDLLSPELRQEYSGNYIAFVPVTVEGQKPVEQIAKDIHERIRHFKVTKQDVTIFQLTEEAVDQALVGTADDPLSFVVTNWNNYCFLNTPDFLSGCKSLRHQSGVNIEPKDTLGAILVNRPILVINMSPESELCLSFFPSLRAEQENIDLSKQIGKVIVSRELA